VISYFETSAIVKLLVVEEGTDKAAAIWDASDLSLTSRLAYTEARAALAAARRARRISTVSLEGAKRALEGRFEELDVVEVAPQIARSAGDLAETHALRGYDAIHLASAVAVRSDELVFVTWDRDLARAGRAVGLDLAGIGAE
jgi:predicted nucleic acid-binding protein